MTLAAITETDTPFLPRGVRTKFDTVRDMWVLLAPERAVKLDPIGAAILAEVDGARTLGEIAGELAAKYNAPAEQIKKDAGAFLMSLIERRMVELR
ncbi:pyrroloquinoline quinone biosynthesis peptide chaperone PqqD [Hwanghaeella sp.]|uniref:pyrroloquinoline quinone biosynthesis peptide chaperone PqqD n=1 Tax=Hwanghaeella sp. TaxID=2605943 RepID=UPI003CCBF451